ncbi:MAG: hypothetical protein K2G04_00275 [Oscillospiraceae bacterium]|nr:hypothetical protein [Oscillospiraceae bacterium]
MSKAKCFVERNYRKRGFKIAMQSILLLWCTSMFIAHGDFDFPKAADNALNFAQGFSSSLWIVWVAFCMVKRESPFAGRREK